MTDAITFPASARTIDRFVHAVLGRITLGVSPAGLLIGYLDWLANLAMAPGRQAELAQKAWRKAARFAVWSARAGWQPGHAAVHRAAAPGPPVQRGVAAAAVQLLLPVVPAEPAVVVERHDEHPRHVAAE